MAKRERSMRFSPKRSRAISTAGRAHEVRLRDAEDYVQKMPARGLLATAWTAQRCAAGFHAAADAPLLTEDAGITIHRDRDRAPRPFPTAKAVIVRRRI